MFTNGLCQDETLNEFSGLELHTGSPQPLSGDACFKVISPAFGTSYLSDDFIEVDPTKNYMFSCSVKTTSLNYLGHLGSGHIGFSTYDEQYRFIDLRQCGDTGNTTLARDLNAGDSYIFITAKTGWYEDASPLSYFSIPLLYPATHPEFSAANEYTRIGYGDYNLYYNARNIPLTGSPPSYRLELVTSDTTTPTTFPDIGYSTPAGTPISNGRAGGSYNYALGAPTYPTNWTTYTTPVFTGESANSVYPFRWGTKYIKFLNLRNYNYRTETGSPAGTGTSAEYLIDNVMLVEVPPGKTYPDKLFSTTSVHE